MKADKILKHKHIISIIRVTILLFTLLHAQSISPPLNLKVLDHPWDHGDKIDLMWDIADDNIPLVKEVHIYSSVSGENDFQLTTIVPALSSSITIDKLTNGTDYIFQLVSIAFSGEKSAVATSEIATPTMQLFDGNRFWLGIIVFLFCGSVIYWINHARKGKPLKIRKIAGLEAVDEAVGRATEMGRSVLFIPGIQDMNEIQTIAGITILSRVAKVAAEYDAKVEVPTSRSLVMTAARETIQASYLSVGRPDAYNQDLIYYVTDEQFGYVAYVQGMMVRDKPAACFYMGAFFAESLLLAETGNTIGAIQLAGTAMPAQLPFFVAACDYTLIGEEFFAASAYLSGEADQLGSLKGQDFGKIIVGIGIIFGVILSTIASASGTESAIGLFCHTAVDYLKNVILG